MARMAEYALEHDDPMLDDFECVMAHAQELLRADPAFDRWLDSVGNSPYGVCETEVTNDELARSG